MSLFHPKPLSVWCWATRRPWKEAHFSFCCRLGVLPEQETQQSPDTVLWLHSIIQSCEDDPTGSHWYRRSHLVRTISFILYSWEMWYYSFAALGSFNYWRLSRDLMPADSCCKLNHDTQHLAMESLYASLGSSTITRERYGVKLFCE